MTDQPSTWAPLDPDAAPSLSLDEGHVVALVTLPGVHEAGSGPRLATSLVRAWSRAGNRVVLADLGLAEPRLHGELGLENRDGVSDSVTFGASVGRVTQAVTGDDAPFFFISAGTAVADPGGLLDHPRWEALCRGFQEAGATLAAFVPWDAATRAQVLRQATEVVLLGAPSDDPSALEEEVGDRLLAFLGPSDEGSVGAAEVPVTGGGEAPTPEGAGEPGPAGADEGPAAEESSGGLGEPRPAEREPAPAGDAVAGDALAGEAGPAEEHEPQAVPLADEILAEAGDAPEPVSQMGEGPPARARAAGAPRGSGRRGLLLTLVVLVVAAVLGWLLGVIPTPWSAPSEDTSSTPTQESVAPLSAAEPAAGGVSGTRGEDSADQAGAGASVEGGVSPAETEVAVPTAAWAVAVEAHEDRATAWQRTAALADVVPEQLWITVPVEVDGTVYHRVLFGTAGSWPAVVELRDRVAGDLGATPSAWIPRPTTLAFELAETGDLQSARARADELREVGIPAYALAVARADGAELYRVYAGGFENAAEARVLQELLQEAGLADAPLIERTGRHPG